MNKKRILIGSCGGLTGCYLAQQFQRFSNVIIIGADTNSRHVSRPFLDEFIILPPATDSDFREALADALAQYRIDCYLPTHSQEIKMVSKYETWLRTTWGGNFLVSPYETYEKLDDKRNANLNLLNAGLLVPRLIDDFISDEKYPIFMKANVGSGGKMAQVIESSILHKEYSRLYSNCSFYELIHGTEYTVDCMFDNMGRLLAYNQRVRLKSMGGAVIMTQNNYDFDILPYLKKIESAFVIRGCVNFQYILSENTPYFIDINLRYASGGLPLTVESGIDVPRILLDIWDGNPLDYVQSCGVDRKTMYRYFKEWYETL